MHNTFLFLLWIQLVVCALKFEYTTETKKNGTIVFLVPFQISFVYPPLLNIELSTDNWQFMHNSFRSLLRITLVVWALKFEYTTETNKTSTVVLLVPFRISFLYPPLSYIELSTDGCRQKHNTFLSLLRNKSVVHPI